MEEFKSAFIESMTSIREEKPGIGVCIEYHGEHGTCHSHYTLLLADSALGLGDVETIYFKELDDHSWAVICKAGVSSVTLSMPNEEMNIIRDRFNINLRS